MSSKKDQEKWKFVLEIGAFVISVFALLISWQSSMKANKISEQANQARIVLINTLDVQRDYTTDLENHICRTQIRFTNIGGIKTSLVSIGYKVRMNDLVDDFEISDFGNHGYLGDGILILGYAWDESNAPTFDDILSEKALESSKLEFPYEIDGNSTVDIFADTEIMVDPQKYKFLLWWLRSQPANPTYSKDYLEAPHISVEYSLTFANGDKVTTPALACFFFEQ
jgi:hypothetical protein